VLCLALTALSARIPAFGQSAPPATFTVTSLVDDATGAAANCNQTQNGASPLPYCNLRDAFAAVAALTSPASVPIINFASTLNTGVGTVTPTAGNPATYALGAAGSLLTYNSMNIVGLGASLLTISGGDVHQIFVFFGGTISVSGLTLSHGYGGNGGAVESDTPLTVSDCTVTNSSATDGGGGLSNTISTLTVVRSTVSGNTAQKSGAIDNQNGTLTVIDSTINNNTALDGGAIESNNTLTVVDSTFYNNSATLDQGGAINNFGGSMTVTGSTLIGNTAMNGGGAIYTLNQQTSVSNSILSGNSTTTGAGGGIDNLASTLTLTNDVIADTIAGTYTNNGSLIAGVNGISSINVALAPLGNYGGLTQTMIPLPGSQAICAGTKNPGDDASGNPILLGATDQRGASRTNTIYPGYSTTTPCVDAGAVQTAYALSFTAEPPASVQINSSFAAAATLDEASSAFAPGVQIPLTLNQSPGSTAKLTGGLAATVNGVATYSLKVDQPGTNDSLTSTLTLNGFLNPPHGLALTATSSAFDVTPTSAPPAATPTFNVAAGTYTSAQTVTISDATAGVTIYYTINGTTPTTSSPIYGGPITVSASETLRAIATAAGYSTSAVATAAYTITPPAATPTFSPAAGTYTAAQSVTISDITPGAAIYYTTDGTTPTTGSLLYGGPISVSASETIEAIAVATGYAPSGVATAAYIINLPPPSFTISGTTDAVTRGATTGNTSTITVTPAGGFTGPVTLTAAISASPGGAVDMPTFSFGSTSPANVTGTNPVTAILTISTTAATSAALSLPRSTNHRWLPAGATVLAGILLFISPARKRWRNLLGMMLLLVACAMGTAACGGGSNAGGGGGGGGTGNPGTTPGNYTITISGTAGSLTETGTLTLTVN
jgi:hypothetical protein